MANKRLLGCLLLFLTAFIWGGGFVAQKIGSMQAGTFMFSAARFFAGGIALIPCVILGKKKNRCGTKESGVKITDKEEKRKRLKTLISGGFFCGLFLCLGTIFQQMGLVYTSVGKAGFITALYIVLVPLLGVFWKKKVTLAMWLSVIIATIGLYLLCIHEGFSINMGDALVLLCSLFFAFHILVIDYFSPRTNGVQMSCIQFFVAAIISSIFMILFEEPNFSALWACWVPVLYLGIVSGAIAFTLQILGQKYTNPTLASLILSTESVFAAIAGWLFLQESFTAREIIGCFLVFGAIIWSQLSAWKHKPNEKSMVQK